jgi:hypothetical protein
MDTRTAKAVVDPAKQAIAVIKARMPLTYAAVEEKAKEIGNEAYALVRRGARGERGCFYAFEAGRTVGTPFDAPVPLGVARLVARYGMKFVCIWPESTVMRQLSAEPPAAAARRTAVGGPPVSRRNAEFRAFIDGVQSDDRDRGGPQMMGAGSDGAG